MHSYSIRTCTCPYHAWVPSFNKICKPRYSNISHTSLPTLMHLNSSFSMKSWSICSNGYGFLFELCVYLIWLVFSFTFSSRYYFNQNPKLLQKLIFPCFSLSYMPYHNNKIMEITLCNLIMKVTQVNHSLNWTKSHCPQHKGWKHWHCPLKGNIYEL